MKKVTLAILAVAVLSVGAIIGISQVRGDKEGRHNGEMRHGLRGRGIGLNLRALDLTEDQKAKVKAIFDASRETMKPLMAEMAASHKKLAELNKVVFDEGATRQAANEQAAIMAKIIVERARTRSQVMAILTDEQKAKAAEFRTMRRERKMMRKAEKADAATPAPKQ
ncbi:MAG: P pilus assembly/Cpx signaling pathway, periplasmic inhibitor/zinc-resistance associated protein [Acidobacteria bacterium OLB17]|nr:MAG: P pilus assembly/Cpx signaling pathway, periplasmic inhibitor/zinc-resistance associated protein [Acidobacteria bacterium OLB17]MCZ2389690.1 Spy/CpxP family protein refolding chaperone [Acidobacteriota bacterium]